MAVLNYTELQQHRKKFLSLEKEWAKTRRKLLRLPSKLGFKSIEELMEALLDCAHSRDQKKISSTIPSSRRRRSVITPEIRTKVKELVSAGKTSVYISERVGISVPTVHNIKKKLGLVASRVR